MTKVIQKKKASAWSGLSAAQALSHISSTNLRSSTASASPSGAAAAPSMTWHARDTVRKYSALLSGIRSLPLSSSRSSSSSSLSSPFLRSPFRQ